MLIFTFRSFEASRERDLSDFLRSGATWNTMVKYSLIPRVSVLVRGDTGFDVEFERDDGDEWRPWVEQLRPFLHESGYPIGTYIEVFPPEWNEGDELPDFPVFDH